ncbi:unnamed protein product [Didymodactylos carnosus]|uniref:Uncharacterized protein n=1 Tax=Didymodactylos carnosus TaxID=1234261 RepID=A0A814YRR4_9BILA|nr:unnamed protein product [Didymodactylos carnosus]CAF3995298.1 unnamed protein product [Didymodactylos carnosus]
MGRPCAKCRQCRDWYYTGDSETWKWIQNYKNWIRNDPKCYTDNFYKCFKRRDGATCLGRYYVNAPKDDYGYSRDYPRHRRLYGRVYVRCGDNGAVYTDDDRYLDHRDEQYGGAYVLVRDDDVCLCADNVCN